MSKSSVNSAELDRVLRRLALNAQDMLDLAGAGAKIVINSQRTNVPRETGETRVSIGSHITKATAQRVVDEIGPETEYAIFLEYGTGIYAENGDGRKTPWVYRDSKGKFHRTVGARPQPFVRPSANQDKVQAAIAAALRRKVEQNV